MSDPTKPDRLAGNQLSEYERRHMVLIADAQRGLADIAAGRTMEADTALAQRQKQRSETTGQALTPLSHAARAIA